MISGKNIEMIENIEMQIKISDTYETPCLRKHARETMHVAFYA